MPVLEREERTLEDPIIDLEIQRIRRIADEFGVPITDAEAKLLKGLSDNDIKKKLMEKRGTKRFP